MSYKNIKSFSSFAVFLGVSPQTLNNWRGRNTLNINKIVDKIPEINPNWLLTGEGDMLKEGDDRLENFNQSEFINLIPVYGNVTSVGGYNDRVADLSAVSQPSGYINIGSLFRGGTCAIVHIGDSMLEYPSGCLLILREIQGSDIRYISSGNNYVIETKGFRVTKRVSRGRDNETIMLYSTNEECYANGDLIHPPFSVHLSEIQRMFKVVGSCSLTEGEGELFSYMEAP